MYSFFWGSKEQIKKLRSVLEKLQDASKGDSKSAKDIKRLLAANLALGKGDQKMFNYIMRIPDWH